MALGGFAGPEESLGELSVIGGLLQIVAPGGLPGVQVEGEVEKEGLGQKPFLLLASDMAGASQSGDADLIQGDRGDGSWLSGQG